MKNLNQSNYNNELVEIEPTYPSDYRGIYSEGYYGSVNQGDEKQLLKQFVSTLRKHWFMISCLTLVVTAATIVYVAQKPDYYISNARVQVNSENNPAMGGRSGGVIVNNSGTDPAYFTTQLQILEGSGLSRRVIETLDLENNPSFTDPQRGKRLTVFQNVRKMFGLYRPPASDQADLNSNSKNINTLNLGQENSLDPDKEIEKLAPLVNLLKNGLIISPVKDSRTTTKETRLIDIQFTHEDPVLATKIVNTIGDVYVLQNLEQKIQTNASAGDFLQKRVAELQSAIRSGEEQLINYSKQNPNFLLEPGQNTVVQRLTSLNSELGQAENDRIAAQSAYQAATQNQLRSDKDAQVVTLEAKLSELRQKLAVLKTEYTDSWPEVVLMRKQIEGVENQLSALRQRASDVQLSVLKEKLVEATSRERELRNNFNSQRANVIKQNEASINYNIIQQEITTNKTLLQSMLESSRTNDVVLSGTPNNVLVADRAVVATTAAGPDRSKNVLLAFLVSLGLGCGLAFLLEWLNDSVHNSDEIENNLGLPLLAAIPAAPLSFGKRLMPKRLGFGRKTAPRKDQYDLAAFEKPEFLEAYVQLRTHIMLSTAGGAPKTILVTSGEESEGKSLTALNLASSLAKTGDKVLLMDADLRCPRINVVKELSNKTGLTTLLIAGVIDEQLLEQTIQKDPFSNLHILTAGERTVNPANLLSSEQMRTLITILSQKYKHIVIDSPPVLYFADTTILSTLVDAVIMVIRDNSSSRQSVLKARKMLQSVGARIIGMVMNGIPRQKEKYGKYTYYETGGELASESDYQTLKIN